MTDPKTATTEDLIPAETLESIKIAIQEAEQRGRSVQKAGFSLLFVIFATTVAALAFTIYVALQARDATAVNRALIATVAEEAHRTRLSQEDLLAQQKAVSDTIAGFANRYGVPAITAPPRLSSPEPRATPRPRPTRRPASTVRPSTPHPPAPTAPPPTPTPCPLPVCAP